MHHEASLWTDTTFWYGIAVFLFVLLMIVVARKPVAAMMDAAIARVVSELAEAKRLRAEAAATLESYKAKQADALREAEEIVARAKDDAARLRAEAEEDLKAMLAAQEQHAKERIQSMQEEAIAEVRTFVIEETMKELRGKLAKSVGTPDAAKMIDKIIGDLPKIRDGKVA